MTRICLRQGAVNLSQGFPDFNPPKELTDRLAELVPDGLHQYSITWGAQNFRAEELEAAFRRKPKALILCNPLNPCGKVFSREELLYIASLAEKYDKFAIPDEVYEHIVYAPHEHVYFVPFGYPFGFLSHSFLQSSIPLLGSSFFVRWSAMYSF